MELLAGLPEWVVWCTGAGAGLLALLLVANIIEAALDLEAP
jgi:hypothetical protein